MCNKSHPPLSEHAVEQFQALPRHPVKAPVTCDDVKPGACTCESAEVLKEIEQIMHGSKCTTKSVSQVCKLMLKMVWKVIYKTALSHCASFVEH